MAAMVGNKIKLSTNRSDLNPLPHYALRCLSLSRAALAAPHTHHSSTSRCRPLFRDCYDRCIVCDTRGKQRVNAFACSSHDPPSLHSGRQRLRLRATDASLDPSPPLLSLLCSLLRLPWCRLLCPLASLQGIYSRFSFSRSPSRAFAQTLSHMKAEKGREMSLKVFIAEAIAASTVSESSE